MPRMGYGVSGTELKNKVTIPRDHLYSLVVRTPISHLAHAQRYQAKGDNVAERVR
jgi:hypothetical protein